MQDNKTLRKYINKRIKQLNKEWTEEAEKDCRKRPMDYLKIGNIEGHINGLMEALTMLSEVAAK